MRLVLGGGERGRHCGREATHLLGSWPSPADVHRAASVVELAFASELAFHHGPNQGAAPVGGNLRAARRHTGAVCSLEKLALLTDEAQPIGPIGGNGGVRELEITQGMCG
jgi:hypothetical protein